MEEYYSIRVADSSGNHIKEIVNIGSDEGSGLEYTLTVGKPSVCRVTLPRHVPRDMFQLDGRITVWRTVGGRGPFQEGQAAFLVRKWETRPRTYSVTGYHANTLMDRRYVCYDKSTTFSDKSTATAAGDLMKTLWKENAGASIDTASRDGTDTNADITTYVTTESNKGDGATVTTQAGRRQLTSVIEELAGASLTAGTYIAAEIVDQPGSQLQFRTYATARGRDRRTSSTLPLLFSEESGTLHNVELVEDYTEEKTAVIAVGAGDDDLRLVQVALDTTRLNASPLNRIELAVELSNIDDDVQLLNAAQNELQLHRPEIYLTADLPDGSPYIRGIHYDYGDLITVEFEGRRFDCRLDSMRVSLGHGSRSTQIALRSITP